ncbi:MAG TPA: iron-containing alcohol dehydrogenase family protein [Nakamurella sp.]|jgi:glycerol-1-phosphate dehydrogenase [NAD(P)+]|nr:iron-containing alcohol dehydrogenase family protein [Nakamurella sp.]
MPILSRLVPAPLIMDIRRGALSDLPATLSDGRLAVSGRLLVITSGGAGTEIARPLREFLPSADFFESCPTTFTAMTMFIEQVRSRSYEAVIGLGGGRVLDAAKYIATRLGVPIAVVPTTLAHDGIASPVSILANEFGRGSYGVAAPLAAIIDLDVVANAPRRYLRSGVGDVLSNLCAIEDWEMAHALRSEPVDGLAVAMARSAATAVQFFQGDPESVEFVRVLAEGLILSGLAMSVAGSSRPCSGACHEISHAIDLLYPDRMQLHGEQVALGACFATMLREDDTAFRSIIAAHRRFGIGVRPADLGLTEEDFCRAVSFAPQTRPGRHTVLEQRNLNQAEIVVQVRRYVRVVESLNVALPFA